MTNITDTFTDNYYLLTPTERRIWKLLQWYHQHHKHVFPSHQTIADKVECSRRTVVRAIKRFVTLGWLAVRKMAYQSCCYYMQQTLIWLNLKDKKTFAPERPPDKECHTVCHRECHSIKSIPSNQEIPHIPKGLWNQFIRWMKGGRANARREKLDSEVEEMHLASFKQLPCFQKEGETFTDQEILKWLRLLGNDTFTLVMRNFCARMNNHQRPLDTPKGYLINQLRNAQNEQN